MNEIAGIKLNCRLGCERFQANARMIAFCRADRFELVLFPVEHHIVIVAGTNPEFGIIVLKAFPDGMLVPKIQRRVLNRYNI